MDFLPENSQIWSSLCGPAVMNPTSIHEDVGSIPGLTQWVKDLALGELWCRSADAARILCCCGCGVGWQRQFDLTPSLGTSICRGAALQGLCVYTHTCINLKSMSFRTQAKKMYCTHETKSVKYHPKVQSDFLCFPSDNGGDSGEAVTAQ